MLRLYVSVEAGLSWLVQLVGLSFSSEMALPSIEALLLHQEKKECLAGCTKITCSVMIAEQVNTHLQDLLDNQRYH